MPVTIRYARESDEEIVNILREEVNALHVNGRPDIYRGGFPDELRNFFRVALQEENYDVIVAELDGKVCGYTMVQYVDRPASQFTQPRRFVHVEEFGVDVSCRRKGVATAMITFCREEAARKNFPKLELSVWSFNEEAIAFYEAIGFTTYRRFMELTV